MNFLEFYLKVIDSFNKNQVDYMLVGGYAVNFHGYIRATGDLDLWVDTRKKTLRK